ncbi:MAG: cobalt ECF transporter T component CbiQ [Desulfatiglans sp.]|jgi:cobalt/nickel transport system permease protein|nr:cobalt ECF transporter T component CbiQ [Desulfatiglans sp.]
MYEDFVAGNSIIHRLDPRVKVVFAAVYSSVVALLSSFPVLITALFVSCLLTVLSRYPVRDVIRRVVVVNGLILFFWCVVPLTFGGESLWDLGPFTIYREGVLLSARITLKSNAIVLAFLSLISSLSLATLGHVLARMGVPTKIVYLLLLTYRYLFVIEREYQRLVRSAKVRGFRPSTTMHTYRTLAYFLGMLFVRASERGERVYQAMLCRGFKGRFHTLQEFSSSPLDWTWAFLMTAVILGLVILEWIQKS